MQGRNPITLGYFRSLMEIRIVITCLRHMNSKMIHLEKQDDRIEVADRTIQSDEHIFSKFSTRKQNYWLVAFFSILRSTILFTRKSSKSKQAAATINQTKSNVDEPFMCANRVFVLDRYASNIQRRNSQDIEKHVIVLTDFKTKLTVFIIAIRQVYMSMRMSEDRSYCTIDT
jgi:hypothetical protein